MNWMKKKKKKKEKKNLAKIIEYFVEGCIYAPVIYFFTFFPRKNK